MTKRLLVLATVAALCIGLSAPARAAEPAAGSPLGDADLNVLLQTIRANRRALIEVNLNLPADEATKFWPVYDRYQKEINVVGDKLAAIVEDYITHFRDLSNEKALELIEGYLGAEAERNKIRQTYVSEFAKVVPGRTVARFYQIENKMDAVLRYDLAATIPVVDAEAPGAP